MFKDNLRSGVVLLTKALFLGAKAFFAFRNSRCQLSSLSLVLMRIKLQNQFEAKEVY